MAKTYNRRYGVDWPPEMNDIFIDMTVAKKWRMFKEVQGIEIAADPGECLEKALVALYPDHVKISTWTRQMIHGIAHHDRYSMIGCGACGKSFIMAACGILYWLTDPFDTAVVFGSATLLDLKTRSWGALVTLFSALKGNVEGIPIPGKLVTNQYAVINERDERLAESMSMKSAIQGRALDEGRIHGLHLPWVMLVVDELSLVRDIEALKTTISNISIGTMGFKCITAANPDPWEAPSSCFYLPPKGVKVDENTGSWTSAMGYFVEHFDGLKSPVVLDPMKKKDFPFLMSQDNVQQALALSNGDPTHPRFYQMVRGFPRSGGGGIPTVLDPLVAVANKITLPPTEPMSGHRRRVGLASGVDPAWSENGDPAIYSSCEVIEQDGRPILDFTNRTNEIPLSLASPFPMTQQLRNGVVDRLNRDGGPRLSALYVDSSGNQGLADDLDIYVGAGCGHINASTRASEWPLRALDPSPARLRVRDRGAEAWVVLAEFCRAGMVRGLPQGAADGLVQRRFALRPGSTEPMTPLRLEPKEAFITRFKGSPNETDACALAALAVKEQLGILPYGAVPAPVFEAQVPDVNTEYGGTTKPAIPDIDYLSDAFDDIELFEG